MVPTGVTTEPVALPPAECRRLLETLDVGHLAITIGSLSCTVVVRYTVSGDRLAIDLRDAPGLAHAAQATAVAFEAGTLDPRDRRGWSVEVRGPARADTDGRLTIAADLITGRAFPT